MRERQIVPPGVLLALVKMMGIVGIQRYMEALTAAVPDTVFRAMYAVVRDHDEQRKNFLSYGVTKTAH